MPVDKPIKEAVVLVHGLWMRGWVMAWLGWRLRQSGFQTVYFSYRSVRATLCENAQQLSHFVARLDAPRIHFLGHSLGGLVILQMLALHADPRIGRVVLAGCPCHPNFVATRLARHGWGRRLIGRSILQSLGQAESPCSVRDGIGVIAGSKSMGAGRLIGRVPQPNDGVVAVDETILPGAQDRIVLKVCHSCMLLSGEVARQAGAFLRQGHFLHDVESN